MNIKLLENLNKMNYVIDSLEDLLTKLQNYRIETTNNSFNSATDNHQRVVKIDYYYENHILPFDLLLEIESSVFKTYNILKQRFHDMIIDYNINFKEK